MEKYAVIGVMSGTSMDGMDLAYCTFEYKKEQWTFQLGACETIPYSHEWLEKLQKAADLSAVDFTALDMEYGRLVGILVSDFITKHQLKNLDLIASHGHTVFHQPDRGFTRQIGHGASIVAATGLTVACDFRSQDVALGGQGAPLVPIGDRLLFSEYDYCLNLGGFANISYEKGAERIAYDSCPVNTVLNALSAELGHPYDKDGQLAARGRLNETLVQKLDELEYYTLPPPKSLGIEWVHRFVFPLLNPFACSHYDKLHTFTEHVARQLSRSLEGSTGEKVLVTGGGTYNTWLLQRIRALCRQEIVVPDRSIIEYKEALIFAFLGLLKIREEINCLRSVTGASRDHSTGVIYRI